MVEDDGQRKQLTTVGGLAKSRGMARTQNATTTEIPLRGTRISKDGSPRRNTEGRVRLPQTRTVSENVIEDTRFDRSRQGRDRTGHRVQQTEPRKVSGRVNSPAAQDHGFREQIQKREHIRSQAGA